MKIKQFISLFFLLLCSGSHVAQNTMRVHYKNSTEQDILISEVDSVTFVEKVVPDEDASFIGSWLWGNSEAGYYELLTFKDDHTYTGYDNYFLYGFDTMTYGWYSQYGNMLTLQSNGFGYKRMYNWFVLGLANNALEVMTKMGGFTYYKLRQETLHVSMSVAYTKFSEDDSVIFSDGIIVKAVGNQLQGLRQGTTFILVHDGSEDRIIAFKVIVE